MLLTYCCRNQSDAVHIISNNNNNNNDINCTYNNMI